MNVYRMNSIEIQNICYKLDGKFNNKLNKYHEVLNNYNYLRQKMQLDIIKPKWQEGGYPNIINLLNNNAYNGYINKWYNTYNKLIEDTAILENKFKEDHINFSKEIGDLIDIYEKEPVKVTVATAPVLKPILPSPITFTPVQIPIKMELTLKTTPIKTPIETSIKTSIETPIKTLIATPTETPIKTPIETSIGTSIKAPISTTFLPVTSSKSTSLPPTLPMTTTTSQKFIPTLKLSKQSLHTQQIPQFEQIFDIPLGLPNLGVTCFYNSVAQLFYKMRDVTEYLIEHKNELNYDAQYTDFIDILNMLKTSKTHIELQQIREKVTNTCQLISGEEGLREEDAAELLHRLIDILIADVPPINTMYFTEKKYIHTTNMESVTDNIETIPSEQDNIDIIKQLFNNPNIEWRYEDTRNSLMRLSVNDNENRSISDIINGYRCTDITKNTFYHCFEIKNKRVHLNKYTYIYNKYLILHLQIFKRNQETQMFDKIRINIDLFSNNGRIVVRDHNNQNQTYDLIGIIAHRGQTILGGHYIAYIKYNPIWYMYDDNVRIDNIRNIMQHMETYTSDMGPFTPYVLLYEKL
jgi:ubiquitin C-terminal hydrolase